MWARSSRSRGWQRLQRRDARSQASTISGGGLRPAVRARPGGSPAPQAAIATSSGTPTHRSVRKRTLGDPVVDELDVAVGEERRAVEWHAAAEGRAGADLQVEDARAGLVGNDHRPRDRSRDHRLIRREVEPGHLQADGRAAVRVMAELAARVEDRLEVAREA